MMPLPIYFANKDNFLFKISFKFSKANFYFEASSRGLVVKADGS
jgi:hypothetical protein